MTYRILQMSLITHGYVEFSLHSDAKLGKVLHHAIRLGNTIYEAAMPPSVTVTYEASREACGHATTTANPTIGT